MADRRCGTCRWFVREQPHYTFGKCQWFFDRDDQPYWAIGDRYLMGMSENQGKACDGWREMPTPSPVSTTLGS